MIKKRKNQNTGILIKFDLNKSLQELEKSNWGEPQSDSPLVNSCLRLRRVPLKDFEEDDLLRMISQGIGIKYLIPITMELLRVDPLFDHDGSLLGALLQASSKYWDENPNLREEIDRMYNTVLLNEKNNEYFITCVVKDLENAYLTFTEFGPYISLLWDNAKVKQTCNCLAVKLLAIIASRQPIVLEDLSALNRVSISSSMIEHLLKNKFIIYDYEGSCPTNRFFRLSNDFIKQLGLMKKKKK